MLGMLLYLYRNDPMLPKSRTRAKVMGSEIYEQSDQVMYCSSLCLHHTEHFFLLQGDCVRNLRWKAQYLGVENCICLRGML